MRRLGSLLLTAAAIFVFLALFGLAIYVGVFLFLAVAVYLLIAGIKDEFLRHRRSGGSGYKADDAGAGVIDMGEVEIISPRELEGDNILWYCAEGVPLGIFYSGDGVPREENVLLLAVKVRRGGTVWFDVLGAGDNRKYSLEMEKIVQIREADGKVMTVQQFLKRKGIG